MSATQLSHEDALLWLNDWCGRRAFVTILVGNWSGLVHAEGTLSHWTETGGTPADSEAGRYRIGETDLDIGEPGLSEPLRFTLEKIPPSRLVGLPEGASQSEEALHIVVNRKALIVVARLEED